MKIRLLSLLVFLSFSAFSQTCNTGPINLVAIPNLVGSSVTLQWNEVTPVGSWDFNSNPLYFIHLGIGNLSTPILPGITANSKSIFGLTPGATYSFQVVMQGSCALNDGSGMTGQDNLASNITTAVMRPDVPVLTGAAVNSAASITIGWTGTGANYDYEVFTNTGTVVAAQNFVTATSFVINNLNPSTTYFYHVRARNSTATTVFSGTSGGLLTLPAAPIFPNDAVTNVTTTGFVVKWNPSIGATSYHLDISTNAGFGIASGTVTQAQPLSTTATVTDLNSATKYFYRIKATNATGDSQFSSSFIIAAPDEPSPIVVTTGVNKVKATEFTVNWSGVPGATSYRLDVATAPDFNGGSMLTNFNNLAVTGVSKIITGLQTGTVYFVRMRAVISSTVPVFTVTSINSEIAQAQTLPSPPVPTGSDPTETGFTVGWDPVVGADSYEVNISDNAGFSNSRGTITTRSETIVDVSDLNAGVKYFYRVRASNVTGDSPFSSGDVITLPVAPSPVITNAGPNKIKADEFTVTWAGVTGATSYRLDVATAADFDAGSILENYNDLDVTGVSKTVVGLQAGIEYFARVRALITSTVPVFTLTSANSAGVQLRTLPSAPVLVLSGTSATGFTVSWDAIAGADAYEVNISDNAGFTNSRGTITMQSETTAEVSDLNLGVKYFYRVRASNASGNSPFSSGDVITLPATPSPVISNAAPTNIKVDEFTVKWQNVAGATGFRLDVGTDITFSPESLLADYNNLALTGTSRTVTGLEPGVSYFVRMRTEINTVTPPIFSENSTPTLQVITLPLAPETTGVTSITSTGFTANWSGVTGASDGYDVEAAEDDAFGAIAKLLHTTATSQIISGLQPGKAYWWRVRAVNVSGSSASSTSQQVLTSPPVPTSLDIIPSSTGLAVSWNASTSAAVYELFVARDQDFADPLTDFNPKVSDAPTTTAQVGGLESSTSYFLKLRAANGSNSYSEFISKTATTTAPGSDGDNPPPAVVVLKDLSYESFHVAGSSVSQNVSLNVTGGTGDITIAFYHKTSSEENFISETIHPAAGVASISLQESWFDEFGMQFYLEGRDDTNEVVTLKNTGGKPFKIVTSVASVVVPVSTFGREVKNYQIISIPYTLDRIIIRDIFEQKLGTYSKKKWRFSHYKDGNVVDFADGIGASSLEQGQGYWFISKEKPDLTFGLGKGLGYTVDEPFVLHLKKGWNQIGNPFPFNLSWQTVVDANSNNQDLGQEFLVYDPAKQGYADSDVLKVFGGGFVHADNETDITFPVALRESNGRIGSGDGSFDVRPDEWLLRIQARQGESINTLGAVGMRTGASDGRDRFDRSAPPPFEDFVEFKTVHGQGAESLSRDVVTPKKRYTWTVYIIGDANALTELTWDKDIVEKTGAKLILHDVSNQVLIDMSRLSEYSAKGLTSVSIHFDGGDTGVNGDMQVLGMPYPNPFESAVTVPVGYASDDTEQADIAMTVYDLNGRLVAAIDKQDDNASGLLAITWSGHGVGGEKVSPGMYFYSVTVTRMNISNTFKGKIIKK